MRKGVNHDVLPLDEGIGSIFYSINGIGDSRSSELLVSGRTGGSTMDQGIDDVVFSRHKPRKAKRTVNGGDGICEDSTHTRIRTRQNEGEVGLETSMTVSCSSKGDVNGRDVSIWNLISSGSMIRIDKCTTGLRRGKWYPEEESYVNRLILEFKNGLLPLKNGTTLRAFLSRLLNCDPMRISKKFVGHNCVGKQTYKRKHTDVEYSDVYCNEVMLMELAELEMKVLKRISTTHGGTKPPPLSKMVQVFEDPEEQCCKVHETSTTEALDGDFPISRRPLAHDNLASPEFIMPGSDTVDAPELHDLDSEGDSSGGRKTSQNSTRDRQYMDGLLSSLDMREEDETGNFVTGQSGPVPSIGSPPVANKDDWPNKSHDCDGDEIAFRFVRERYEPESNMKEFFLSAHDTHMVPVESAQTEGTTEKAH